MRFRELLEEAISAVPADPGQLLDVEAKLHEQVSQECVDPVVGAVIQAAHEEAVVKSGAQELTAAYPHLRLQVLWPQPCEMSV